MKRLIYLAAALLVGAAITGAAVKSSEYRRELAEVLTKRVIAHLGGAS